MVVDIRLPGGVELCKRVRAAHLTTPIQVALASMMKDFLRSSSPPISF